MRKKGKRRKFVVAMSGLEVVAARNTAVDSHSQYKISASMHNALLALTKGEMTRSTWDVMAHAINAAYIMAKERNLGLEYMPQIIEARAAHVEIGRRAVANNMRFVAKGEELTALNAFAEIHDAQMEIAVAADVVHAAQREHQLIASNASIKIDPKKGKP